MSNSQSPRLSRDLDAIELDDLGGLPTHSQSGRLLSVTGGAVPGMAKGVKHLYLCLLLVLPVTGSWRANSAAGVQRHSRAFAAHRSYIIKGQRAITADTALRLGHWFGSSPEFLLNLQKLYELRLGREEIGDPFDWS